MFKILKCNSLVWWPFIIKFWLTLSFSWIKPRNKSSCGISNAKKYLNSFGSWCNLKLWSYALILTPYFRSLGDICLTCEPAFFPICKNAISSLVEYFIFYKSANQKFLFLKKILIFTWRNIIKWTFIWLKNYLSVEKIIPFAKKFLIISAPRFVS